MTRIRQNLLPLYLVCALVTFGHAWNDGYRAARAEGLPSDLAWLSGVLLGIPCAAGWPAYVSAKVWGMADG